MLIETKLSNITWEFFLIMIYIFNLNKIMFKRIKNILQKTSNLFFEKSISKNVWNQLLFIQFGDISGNIFCRIIKH